MSSDTAEVVVRRDDRVVTLTLDRPADQNRLTRSMLLALQRLVDELAGDAEAQAVVITGGTRPLGGFTEAHALSDSLRHAFEWSHDVDEGATAHREGRRLRFTGR